jgi:glycosyltransferase involved in cell wall biosynthesis
VTTVHVVVPEGIDDPARPSGGNTYDRHLCQGLVTLGWTVTEHAVAGRWPRPEPGSLAVLAGVVAAIPDDALVVIDGLVASTAPDVLLPEACRLRLVVLVHMPLGFHPAIGRADEVRTRERAVLCAAAAVLTTSVWTRRRLIEHYDLAPERVHVAQPGVDAASLAPGTAAGVQLLSVAAVTYYKGHDVLLSALATIEDLSWRCTCVGSLDRDPPFVERVRRRAHRGGLADRVSFPGPQTGADLDRHYATADLLVLASRAETYGMVVTEALAHGLPVVAADVGGLSEALGHSADGNQPGLLVAPGDPAQLAGALRAWLCDAELRVRLRRAAHERRASLPGWANTASTVHGVLVREAR